MKVTVQLFSILRECLPKEAERGRAVVELTEGVCLDDLFDFLNVDRCLSGGKRFAEMLSSWQVSVNGEFTEDLSRELHSGDVVIVFPHMAGGLVSKHESFLAIDNRSSIIIALQLGEHSKT